MNVLVIPDIHQGLKAVEIIETEYLKDKTGAADKIVFLGDLVDEWTSDKLWSTEQNPLKVISRIVNIKKALGDKFIWLLGNHDLGYLYSRQSDSHRISGHQYSHEDEIGKALMDNLSKIQICTKIDDVVYSHGGFTKTWLNYAKSIMNNNPNVFTKNNIIDRINQTLIYDSNGVTWYNTLFDHKGLDPYGDDTVEGPLWVRPSSVIIDNAFHKQIVGHTEIDIPTNYIYNDYEITVVDTKSHDNFIVIKDGDLHNEKINQSILSKNKINKERERREIIDRFYMSGIFF